MKHQRTELEIAWGERPFWRDFAVWWETERGGAPEPRILEALDEAEKRYEQARLEGLDFRINAMENMAVDRQFDGGADPFSG